MKKRNFVKCNLCFSDSPGHYIKIEGFSIVKCKMCGLIYVNPRLHQDELHEIYHEKYFDNPAFVNKKDKLFGYHQYLKDKKLIIATFKKQLKNINRFSKKGKLLDVGCAHGFFLEIAKKNGWDVQGIEISKEGYNYVKKKLKIKVSNKTLEKSNFKKDQFDVITMLDVIEHLSDPHSAIKHVNKILKPNGLFVITTPDIGSLTAKLLGKYWEEIRRVREHIYFFSRKTLTKMLEKNGFKVLKIESAGRYFTIKTALERSKLYNQKISSFIEKVCKNLKIQDKMIYINPFYKITVYAKKINKKPTKK